MTATEARTLIRYSGWASRKVMAAARGLTQEQREQANGISHRSIAGTLTHIYLADRAWQGRVAGSTAPLNWDATWVLAEVEWPRVQQDWEAWADAADDAELARTIEYKSLAGTPSSNTTSEIVTHVVNHATLHRGQVVGMIRQLGVAPPDTDFIYYLRELK